MVKNKRKSILRTLLCAVVALCFAVGLSLFASGTTAYAAITPSLGQLSRTFGVFL